MSGKDYCSDEESCVSDDSVRPEVAVYPLNEEVEVPGSKGQLFKTVLVEGTGRYPAKGSKVSVHYVGTLMDGTEFDSSRKRGSFFEFQLGKGQVIKGWDLGVATMKVGEKSILRCLPEYAYGASGHPPTIPANSTLKFEVELFSWTKEEDISSEKDRSVMKRVLLDGVGLENPSLEAALEINLAIFAGGTDEEVEALADENSSLPSSDSPKVLFESKNWSINIGETVLPPYLEQCLMKMRKEEVAIFRLQQNLIPSEGCNTFHIPSVSQTEKSSRYALMYRVEVLSLSNIHTWDFKGMKKVEEGMGRKNRANTFFKEGDLERAITFYRRSLEFIGEDFGYNDEEKKAAKELRVVVWGNLAQALLLQYEQSSQSFSHHPREAIKFLEKALAEDSKNVKNLYRMGKAQYFSQNMEEAKKALGRVLEVDAGNFEAQCLLEKVKKEIKEFNQKQKSLFSKMFA